MDELKLKFQITESALKSLETSYRYFSVELDKLSLAHDLELKKISRDSVIQRFEYTVELLWKLLFYVLQKKFLLDLAASPKITMREALKVKLLNEEETENGLNMINDRNLTSHIYKEEVAAQLIEKIPKHIILIKTILKRIKEEL